MSRPRRKRTRRSWRQDATQHFRVPRDWYSQVCAVVDAAYAVVNATDAPRLAVRVAALGAALQKYVPLSQLD